MAPAELIMHPESAPAAPSALLARRTGAFVVHALLFVIVAAASSRFLAGLQQETVPVALRGDNIDLCDVVASAADAPTSICFQVGHTLYSSTSPYAPAKILVPAIVALLLNSVVLATTRGASIGMHLFGLRVVRRDTGALAGADCHLLRWVAWIIDGFALYVVGLAAVLTTRGQRRIGDLVAGTVVVTERAVGVPPVLAAAIIRPRPVAPASPAATPVAPQWEAAPSNRVSPDPQPGASRPLDDVASPPRPLT